MKQSNGSLLESAVLGFMIGVLSSALGVAIMLSRELNSSKPERSVSQQYFDELSKICVSLGQIAVDTSHKVTPVLEQEPLRQLDDYEKVCRSLDNIGAAGPSYVWCDLYERWTCNREKQER